MANYPNYQPVQWRLFLVVFHVQVSSFLAQNFNYFLVTLHGCYMKRSRQSGPLCVNVGAVLET